MGEVVFVVFNGFFVGEGHIKNDLINSMKLKNNSFYPKVELWLCYGHSNIFIFLASVKQALKLGKEWGNNSKPDICK